jgi:3-oxoacyl-[acyl-carrier protein] reductase
LAATLEGFHCIVTGASRGLGAAVARELRSRGANLLLTATDAAALERQRDELLPLGTPLASIHLCAANLARPDSPGRILDQARRHWQRLDGLVNNAAIVGPTGALWDNDWEEWTETIRVNLLAPAALCRLAVPRMKQSGGGSIVNLSGGGATGPRPGLTAYATAKAALVRFTETLAQEAGGFGVRVNAVAPGGLATRMLDKLLAAGEEQLGAEEYARIVERKRTGGDSPERAAKLIVLLLSPEGAGISGRLLSAVWDPWEDLPARAADLADEWYTLRRITPEDAPR